MLGALLACAVVLGQAPLKVPVFVTASLTDRNGLFVENLTRDEIRILEDGAARPVEFMAKDEIPTVYGILFERALIPQLETLDHRRERSPSAIASARDIAYELIDKLLARQSIWVGVYERDLEIALEPSTDRFRVKDTIQRLAGTRRPATAFLYGALVAAVQKMSARHEKRRVLLLFLESADAESAGRARALRNLLAASNMELFVVSFGSRLGPGRGMPFAMSQAFLRDLADATAGEAHFAAEQRDHLDDISRRMYNQIRTFYTFGFLSQATPDKPARLVIECARPGSRGRHHSAVAGVQ